MGKIDDFIFGFSEDTVLFCVTPEVLNDKASEVRASVQRLRSGFERLNSLVAATSGFWQGEAADAHRDQYNAAASESGDLLDVLDNYSVKLNVIAGNYNQAESSAKSKDSGLPEDAIV